MKREQRLSNYNPKKSIETRENKTSFIVPNLDEKSFQNQTLTMALPKLIQSNDSNFEKEILRQPIPAIICFWANWSGPSKLLTPVIAEMAETYGKSFLVGMINVDESPLMSATYGIQTLPTFLVFREGQVVKRIKGAVNRDKIEALFLES